MRTWCFVWSSAKPFIVVVLVVTADVCGQLYNAAKSSAEEAQGQAELKTGMAPGAGEVGKSGITWSES